MNNNVYLTTMAAVSRWDVLSSRWGAVAFWETLGPATYLNMIADEANLLIEEYSLVVVVRASTAQSCSGSTRETCTTLGKWL